MNTYFLENIHKRFHSLRKEAREKIHLSFHKAYLLCILLIIILGVFYIWMLNAGANSGYQMNQVESIRREKQQEKHRLRSDVAEQESFTKLKESRDRLVPYTPETTQYIFID